MKRRSFLAGATAGGAISMLDWLGWFQRYGVPGTSKSLGFAEAAAQATVTGTPHFLIYWFQEGGWDSYCLFSPLDTPNHAGLTIAANTLDPTPSWSSQFYRPRGYGPALGGANAPRTLGPLSYGYLGDDATELLPDMAIVSSHAGNTFHSGGRWEYHYGKYQSYAAMTDVRKLAERSVLQAFAEQYGSAFPIAHVSWHRFLSDGELEETNYPEGTGYYERLGPAYAHTVYGRTPSDMRARLASLATVTAGARNERIRTFVDNLNSNFLKGKQGETITAFDSAVKVYKQLTGGTGVTVNPATLFTDPTLRAEFNVKPNDEVTSSTSINGNPARSKDTPNTNVQAMMTYELMTKGLSIGFWLENREIRGFDTHLARRSIMSNDGQRDQKSNLGTNLWSPLKTLVKKLKTTQFGTSGKTYWDYTTIVLASEMGRTIQGDVASLLATTDPDEVKYGKILDQDCCQHWHVNSVAFLGGTVKGNTQYGRVGTSSLEGIPVMPDGSLDPAFDPITGRRVGTPDSKAVITDAGHVYATALSLSGIDPAGKGLNVRPALGYIKKG